MNTTLEEYAGVVISIAKICKKEREANPKSYKHLHIWYLYRQAFYGFIEFIDLNVSGMVSEKALKEYQKTNPSGNLRLAHWSEQPKFDTDGRQKGKFHLEHIYTGDMFRNILDLLPENECTAQNVAKIIQDNYRVAWILKEENKLLPKSKRGKTLNEAMDIYKKCGIYLQ